MILRLNLGPGVDHSAWSLVVLVRNITRSIRVRRRTKQPATVPAVEWDQLVLARVAHRLGLVKGSEGGKVEK